MDPVEEIRSRLNIVDVVSPYIQLKKSGRTFKSLCPFHEEKTPSFHIDPDKGIAYCFGCRQGGDIFSFIQTIENVDFKEALRILGEKAGVEIKQKSIKEHQEHKSQQKKLEFLITQAQKLFVLQLQKTPKAIEYLKKRGYTSERIKAERLGYSLESFSGLSDKLKKDGTSIKNLVDSGLVIQKSPGSTNIYDRFRNRIMFPIHNSQGKLVGFGGRSLSSDDKNAKIY